MDKEIAKIDEKSKSLYSEQAVAKINEAKQRIAEVANEIEEVNVQIKANRYNKLHEDFLTIKKQIAEEEKKEVKDLGKIQKLTDEKNEIVAARKESFDEKDVLEKKEKEIQKKYKKLESEIQLIERSNVIALGFRAQKREINDKKE